MVRATSRAPSVGMRPSHLSKRRDRRKKPYKVQLEQVMAKKKRLKIHDIHGSAKPRPGYTFLPVGYADLAERCKEQSRLLGAEVAVVSAGTRKDKQLDPQKLTHHVHRVGYHFRTDIFDSACNFLGYREVAGKLVRETGLNADSRFEQTIARYGPRFDLIDINNHSAEESTKVKKYIRELFPKIPEEDLNEIYKRAWEEGATTVGNAHNLSLSRQVQLATIARIRHTYTNYDRLLREVSWKEARQAVEQTCLSILIQWRGEQDNDPEELEEILRETIVIDDDDDDDDADTDSNVDSDDDLTDAGDGSDTSLEIVQQTVAPIDLRVEASEKPRPQRKAFATAGRAMDRVLPAAMQNRWRDARVRHQAVDNHAPQPQGHAGQISVHLDQQGNAPRKIVTGGVEYVRIPSPSRYAPLPDHFPVPGPLPHTGRENTGRDFHHWDSNQRNALPSVAHAINAMPIIDLTTPPRPQRVPREVHRYPIIPAPAARPAVYRIDGGLPAHTPYAREASHIYARRPREANFGQVQTVPPAQSHELYDGGAYQQRRMPSSIEHLDMTKPEDRPIQSREGGHPEPTLTQQSFDEAERRDFGHGHDPQNSTGYRRLVQQPVFGQPAYPQMRSHTLAARATPLPVHGAPAAVQHLSPRARAPSIGQPISEFGAPSPQKYFIGSRERPYYVPHR